MNFPNALNPCYIKSDDNMDVVTAIAVALSTLGGIIASLLGGWDALMDVLVLFMVIDIGLGLYISAGRHKSSKTKTGRFASEEFYKGVTKKFLVFIVIIVAVALDRVMGGTIIVSGQEVTLLRSVVCVFYILVEASSILENLALAGVPLPSRLKDTLEVLRNSYKRRNASI